MLLSAPTPIGPEETAGALAARLATLGADVLIDTLARLDALTPHPQRHEDATLAPRLKRSDGFLDWTRSARELVDLIRGCNPWPGALARGPAGMLTIWRATALNTGPSSCPGHSGSPDRRRRRRSRDRHLGRLAPPGRGSARESASDVLAGLSSRRAHLGRRRVREAGCRAARVVSPRGRPRGPARRRGEGAARGAPSTTRVPRPRSRGKSARAGRGRRELRRHRARGRAASRRPRNAATRRWRPSSCTARCAGSAISTGCSRRTPADALESLDPRVRVLLR